MVVMLMPSSPLNYHLDVELLHPRWCLYPVGGQMFIIPLHSVMAKRMESEPDSLSSNPASDSYVILGKLIHFCALIVVSVIRIMIEPRSQGCSEE